MSEQQKMNPEIKQKWLDALRSGSYRFHKLSSKADYKSGITCYCTLGVLQEIFRESYPSFEWEDSGLVIPKHIAREYILPWQGTKNPIFAWAGFNSDIWWTIVKLNDNPKTESFEPVIKYIEENL
jgi:hypothetical protein